MDTSYNDIPYMGRVHFQTHIEKLSLSARIFGMETTSLEKARVLELGCGDGSNIISMALHFPKAEFVGIDGSTVHIERGRKMLEYAGTTNVRLEAMDISHLQDQFGTFDYIICHGVFSWVPETVRGHILRICREQMNPLGIGYISYNAYPGWKQYEMLRDMMHFHVVRQEEQKEQLLQARALVQFLSSHIPDTDNDPYGRFISAQEDFILGLSDEYLYHEYLEAHNQPYWFYEFIRLLNEHALQYLGDTDFTSMLSLHWPEETKEILNTIATTQYELEQYMDMLRGRRFRCTLFVHHARDVTREIEPDVFKDFYYSYKACDKWSYVAATGTIEPPSVERSAEDIIATLVNSIENSSIQNKLQIAIFQHLHKMWPKRVHFNELREIAAISKGESLSRAEVLGMAELLQTLYLMSEIKIHLFCPSARNTIPEKPHLNSVARYQASYQKVISTQLHNMVGIREDWAQEMVMLMDGTRTVDQLADDLYAKLQKGEGTPLECKDEDGNEITGKENIIALLKAQTLKKVVFFLENGALI